MREIPAEVAVLATLGPQLMVEMGNFVLHMQEDDGRFNPYYVPATHSYYGERNDIVPGEAALASRD